VIQYLIGSSAVGIYSVAYNTVDRTIGSIFIAISMAAFPHTASTFEVHGVRAASRQMTSNGVLLMALTLPACAGLIAAGPQIAAVLIGPAFRAEALPIMPWIVISALMSGMQVHYFDHAFYLGKHTRTMLLSLFPGAVLNVVLNLILLPRIGVMGAVWSTLIAHGVALAASIVLGRRALKFDFPFGPALRIVLASAVMMAAIRWLDFALTPAGLVGSVAIGVPVYGVMCLVFDVARIRGTLSRRIKEWRARGMGGQAALHGEPINEE
jgi:O-antigen/teichoic acid export membrane protein